MRAPRALTFSASVVVLLAAFAYACGNSPPAAAPDGAAKPATGPGSGTGDGPGNRDGKGPGAADHTGPHGGDAGAPAK